MITAGTYPPLVWYHARVDRDFTQHGGTGIITELGRYVAYNADGEFAYKSEDYTPHANPGDTFDLIVEREKENTSHETRPHHLH